MFIIVLGQHVSILTESSSGSCKKIDPYLKCLNMCCGTPNAYILDKTMYKMHVSLKPLISIKNTRFKLLKSCANIYFNKQFLVKKKSDP